MKYSFHSLGDNAVLVELGKNINTETQQQVQLLTAFLDDHPI